MKILTLLPYSFFSINIDDSFEHFLPRHLKSDENSSLLSSTKTHLKCLFTLPINLSLKNAFKNVSFLFERGSLLTLLISALCTFLVIALSSTQHQQHFNEIRCQG
jgi:hypothetical protein